MKVSKNFYLSEFTRSQAALRHGIINKPSDEQIKSLSLLAKEVLQPLRDAYGKSIRINSGFRCKTLNTIIGGSKTSQHCKGQAADIDTTTHNRLLFELIKAEGNFDQLIWEYGDDNTPAWIHVSFVSKEKNRKQILKCFKEKGKTKYIKI